MRSMKQMLTNRNPNMAATNKTQGMLWRFAVCTWLQRKTKQKLLQHEQSDHKLHSHERIGYETSGNKS
jgi:hypothetical protein